MPLRFGGFFFYYKSRPSDFFFSFSEIYGPLSILYSFLASRVVVLVSTIHCPLSTVHYPVFSSECSMPYPTQCLLQYIQFVLLVHNPMFNHLYISYLSIFQRL